MKRRLALWLTFTAALAVLIAGSGSGALASFLIDQTPLDPTTINQFETELPYFFGARVDGTKPLAINYEEAQQNVLPDSFYAGLSTVGIFDPQGNFLGRLSPQDGTFVWRYRLNGTTVAGAPINFALYPADTIVAQEGTATQITYTNGLPASTVINPDGPVLQKYISVDQTLHWANPFNIPMQRRPFVPYTGPAPVVPHLHGGIVASAFDGGPDAWFLNHAVAGASSHGPGYRTLGGGAVNQAIYSYVNNQQPATLWWHEHTLGATRTNVYAGLAGYYFLRGPIEAAVNPPLPSGAQEVEFVIQDRQFDTNGQLFFPDGTPPDAGLNGNPGNPTVHPFWIPEFFGNVIVVNGRSWPKFTAEPRRYRFRLLNGSNARFYTLSFSNGLPFYVIGTDGGLLDDPVQVNTLTFGPGERYDIIIDFASVRNQQFTLTNTARWPYPNGDLPNPALDGVICRFDVGNQPVNDTSYNPAGGPPGLRMLRKGNDRIVRLPGTPGGPAISAKNNVIRFRQLTLNENIDPTTDAPLEVLVNNSHWDGIRPTDGTHNADASALFLSSNSGNDTTNFLTELPQNSTTEIWEFTNLTGDAHPIHIHEFQFQLINRQRFDDAYNTAYANAFPGNAYIPAYGPPMAYNTNQTPGNPLPTIGGNPDVTPYLGGFPVVPPLAEELGWKDTFIMYPGEVTRVAVRWTPQNIKVKQETPGTNMFVGFDPTSIGNPPNGVVNANGDAVGGGGGGPGYVFHCHIIDHEDNEMMRPYFPVTNANNTFQQQP